MILAKYARKPSLLFNILQFQKFSNQTFLFPLLANLPSFSFQAYETASLIQERSFMIKKLSLFLPQMTKLNTSPGKKNPPADESDPEIMDEEFSDSSDSEDEYLFSDTESSDDE